MMMRAVIYYGIISCHARFKVLFLWHHKKRGPACAGNSFKYRTLIQFESWIVIANPTSPLVATVNKNYFIKKYITAC